MAGNAPPQNANPIRFSLGIDRFDNAPDQREARDFDAFAQAVLSSRSPSKGVTYFTGPLSMGPHDDPERYKDDNTYRLATHALPRRFMVIDHDGFRDIATFEQIYAELSELRGFGYTTWSHTDQAPRARAVFELSREVTRPEGIRLGRAFDRMIECAYGADAVSSDKSTHQNEQPAYTPGPHSRIFHFSGQPIDVDEFLSKYPDPPLSQTLSTDAGASDAVVPIVGYSRLTRDSLIKVLGLIDCNPEPVWHAVSNALARAYGEEGRDFFTRFSRGEFWGTPYPGFDATEIDAKFNRALREVAMRPDGYGVRHLMRLAGVEPRHLEFETPVGTPVLIDQQTTATISLPVKGPSGRPVQVLENLDAVLRAQGITVRYNQIAKTCEVLVPGLSCVFDEASNTTLTLVTDFALKAGMSASRIQEMLDALASQRPYCPVQTFIESKPWDGVSRFGQFTGQMQVGNAAFAHKLFRKWLIQAVAAAYEPQGIANAGVLTLTGLQGIGKTMILKDLVSGLAGAFLEGQTLNPADKDSVMTAVSHWVVELGEIDSTFRKADLSQLKAFITKTKDALRRPYARKDSVFPRRTVFAGTVNDFEFLHDSTGNRRFWPIDVQSITRDTTIDYQQLWAEVKSWYEAGEKWYLDATDLGLLNQYSEVFMVANAEVELLLSRYQFVGCSVWVEKSMRDICGAIGLSNPTKTQQMRLAAAIRKYNGGQQPRISNGIKLHHVPDVQAASQVAINVSGTSGTSGSSFANFMTDLEEAFVRS